MSAVDRFAAVPERFTAALRARQITYRQYGLGTYLLATAGHYTRELIRTLEELSAEQGFPKGRDSLSRDLRALESSGWITCEIGSGQRLWRIKITGLLRGTSAHPPQTLRSESIDSAEVISAGDFDAGAGIADEDTILEGLQPPHAAAPLDVDVEEENPPNPPEGGKRNSRRTKEQRGVGRFAQRLFGDDRLLFDSLASESQAELVTQYATSTGLRETRGSGGMGYKADPLGCSPKPRYQEPPPDWQGRASPGDFFRAWLNEEGKP